MLDLLKCRRRYASIILFAAACSKDPDAIATDYTSGAMAGANDCALPRWPTAAETGIPMQIVSGRHDGDELVIGGATGAYLTSVADDNKLLGTFNGNDLAVNRLGSQRIDGGGDCTFRVEADFVGTTAMETIAGTLTLQPFDPTASCNATCTSTITFAP